MALRIAYKVRKKLPPKSEEEVGICFRITESNRLDITVATPFTIPYLFWDTRTGGVKQGASTRDRAIFDRIVLLDSRLNALKKKLYEELFRKDAITREDAKAILEQYLAEISAKSEGIILEGEETPSLPDYVDTLVKRMKSGKKRIGAESYTSGTIKAWNSFAKLIRDFYENFKNKYKRDFQWEDFNKDGFLDFLTYMEKKEYLPTSINKYVKDLNATVVSAGEEGILGDLVIRKHCPRKTLRKEEQPIKVYLTEEELQALYEMPLQEGTEKCKVRDIFLCGAYTGQRISDYNNLSAENFRKTPKGYDIVVLTLEKTNNTVVIPVLNDNLVAIARKYEFRLPRVVEQVLNRYIKDILKQLSLSVPSLAEKYTTVLTMKEREAEDAFRKEHRGEYLFERNERGVPMRPKYDLITSHTARRSCITNLYLQGRFTNEQIMSISGHKDEKTFKEYIVCSGIIFAERIMEINKGKSNAGLFM